MDNVTCNQINWKEIMLKRKENKRPFVESINNLEKDKKKIDKQIRKLNKEMSKFGTTDLAEIIKELIEKEFGFPCRITHESAIGEYRSSDFIKIFSRNATKKQIQYRRPEVEIGSIYVCEQDGKYYQDTYIKDSPEPYDFYLEELPNTIEEILDLALYERNKNR